MKDAETSVEPDGEAAAVIVEGYGQDDCCAGAFDWRSSVHFVQVRPASEAVATSSFRSCEKQGSQSGEDVGLSK